MPFPRASRASIIALACVLAVASAARPAAGAVYNLGATADTWLRESSPLATRGQDQELRAQAVKLDSERPFLALDLSPILPGDYILDATLVLQVTQVGTGSTIDVFPITAPWLELTADWLQNGTSIDTRPVGSGFLATAAGSVSVDVTSLTQAWVDGTKPNYGVALVPRTTNDETRFASREWGTASERPTLVVTTGAPTAGTADLAVAVAPDDATPAELDAVTWTVVVRNLGPNLATSAKVAVSLPAGLTFASSAASQGSYGAGEWVVGSVAAGDSATLAIDVKVDADRAGSRLRVPAAVSGLDQTDPVPANDAAEGTVTVRGGVFRLASGLVFGAGTPNFQIGTGFAPDLVLVKDLGNTSPALATISMQGLSKVPDVASAAAGNMITSLDSTGFTLGTDPTVNQAGQTYHWVAMRAAAGQLVVGDYVGDGTDNRSIGGVGFQPVWVVVAGEGATLPVQRFASLAGDATLAFDASAAVPDRIQLLEADGFQVGTDATVNAAGTTYHFAAWGSVGTEIAQGTYAGDGSDNRQFADPGFAPGFVSILRDADRADFRPASLAGDATLFFSATASANDRIQALLPTGFETGKNNDVNGNGQVYHWIALGDSTGPRADLSVAASFDDPSPDPNQTVTFTVQLKNNGPDGATGVVVADKIPADLAFQSAVPSAGTYSSALHEWTPGPIAAGDSVSLDLVAVVADEPAADSLSALAAVTAVDQLDSAPGDEQASASVLVNGNDLQMALTVDDPAPGEGDTILFHAALLNAGAGTSSSVAASLALPAGLTALADSASQGAYAAGVWDVGALVAGASADLFVSASVDPGTSGSTLVAAAWADSSSRPDPVAANDSDSVSVTVASADLETAMTVDDPAPDVGAPVTFAVTLRNLGPNDASSVDLVDLLPAGLSLQADSVSQGVYAAGTGVWTAGAVAAGDSAQLFLTATPDSGTAGTSIVNTASIAASVPADPNAANDTVSVQVDVPGADLGAVLAVSDPTPAETDSVLFLVTLSNLGPADASGISLTETLPAGLTHVTNVPSQGVYDAPSGAWSVGAIAAGDSATLYVQASVDPGTGGTTLVTRVTGLTADQGDPVPGNDADSVSVTVRSADVRLTNVVSDPTPAAGDTVVYNVAAANFGPDDALGVRISDVLPPGTTYLSHVAGGSTTYDDSTGIWDVGTIVASTGVALQLTATIAADAAGRTIEDTASVVVMDPGDPDPSTNVAIAGLTVQSADLALSAAVSDSLPDVGQAVTLSLLLRNAGPDSASGVTVSAPLPAGLSYQSDAPSQGTWAAGTWSAGAIAAGDSASLDLVATVDPGTGGTSLVDTARVSASLPGDPVAGNDSARVALRVTSADLAVAKTVNNAAPNVGATVTYTVKAHNLGPDPATGVAVADTLPTGLTYQSATTSQGSYAVGTGTWAVGSIAAADSATLMITATVDSSTGGTTLTNFASILAADQADPDGSNDADSASVTVLAAVPVSADLGLAMTLDRAAPDEGDSVAYAVTLTDGGLANASGVVVTDLLPAGLTYAGHAVSQGTYTPGTGEWNVGSMAVGDTLTLDLTAVVSPGTAGATLTNTATITAAAQTDPVPANNTASRQATVRAADVAIALSADTTRASEGDTVVLTVTALNQGPDSTAGLAVDAALPAGLTYAGDVASHGVYDSGTGSWTIGALPPAVAATLDLTVTVDPGTAGSTLTAGAAVAATLRGDPDASNDADSLALPVSAVDLAVVKTVDDPAPDEGSAVTFTVTVRNAGPDSATAVQVTDALPAGLSWQSDLASQGAWASGTGLWDVGTVAPGDSAVLTVTAGVDAGTAGATITNAASVSAVAQADIAPGNEADSASVTVRAADLRITKTVDVPTPYEGGSVRFTVSVANLGPDSTSGVAVLDPLPAGLTWQADSASQGAYASGPGTWTVGSLAAGDSATLALTAGVDAGTAGQTLWNVASVSASSTGDPVAANDADSVSVTVSQGVLLLASQPAARSVLPGETGVHVFTLSLANSQPAAATLSALAFRNTTAGPGTQAQRDAELGQLTLYRDNGDFTFDPRTDVPLATASASAGTATFGGLSYSVPSGAIGTLFVGTDVALAARDADALDLDLAGPGSVSFQGAVTFLNAWPLAPAPSYAVDGMSRAQIVVRALTDGTVLTGARHALVLEAVLPADGYSADTLQQLRAANLGTAVDLLDLTAIELWTDGGNGTFDAGLGDDTYRGKGSWTGSDWSWSGLSAPIPASGLRVFVSADVSPLATPGRTIRLQLPSSPTGVTVASTNDGPVDGAVASPATFTVQLAPSVIVARGAAQTGAVLLPAATPRELFRFELANTAVVAETLSAVTWTNTSSGPGTQAQLDAEWDSLSVTVLSRTGITIGGGRSAAPLFSGGKTTFAGLGATIAAGDTVTVILYGSASRAARDGDVLDVAVASASAITFTDAGAQLTGTFPLAPAPQFPVDGMSAAQITVPAGGGVPATVFTGSTRNVSLLVDIPSNGYEPDTLRYVNLENLGDAAAVDDITAMELWDDYDGDGVPEPQGDDAPGRLGALVFTGNRWELTGLAHPVPPGGERIFVTTDIADLATVSRQIRLVFPTSPDWGLGVASGNDGPVDLEAPLSAAAQSITTADRVTFGTVPIAPGTVAPGATLVPLLRLQATNDYTVVRTLVGLDVANATTGGGTIAQLDSEVGQLHLRADSLGGPELAKAVFSGGTASFSTFSLPVAPGETRDVVIAADVSAPLAADGDVLGAQVSAETEVTFANPTTVAATWPLSSQARWTVNGMLAARILNHGAPPATLGPAEGPVPALDVTLPSNGYAADILRGLTVVNDSTATPADIAQMRLWRDGGDGAFDAGGGDDTDLGPMTSVGGNWVSPALAATVPPGGIRCFVSIVSAPGLTNGTVRLAIPLGGVSMESGNDGPLDARVVNPDYVTLSTAALLAQLVIAPAKSTIGQTITATMTVRNLGDSTIVGIAPSVLAADVPGRITLVGGPAPVSLDLDPGASGSFDWTYVTNTAGTVRLTGNASGIENGSGLVRQSLDATSGAHEVFLPAQEMQVFPVESMPFSVSQGQTGVVPLSLTFTNLAPAGGSPVRITRLAFRLVDATGSGVVPISLLKRVVVNEGTNVYADKSSTLETTGDAVDLPLSLAEALVPPDSGQVTLSLSLDISDSTTVPAFRLEIPDQTWMDGEDATSAVPVTISLAPSASYPIQSGQARVVTEATELEVAAAAASPKTAGRGQDRVDFLDLDLLSPDPDSLAADVRVSRFDVMLTDSAGAVVTQPSQYLDSLRVETAFQTLLARPVTAADDSTITIALSPLLSVPANTPVSLSVLAGIRDTSPTGPVRLVLADSSAFDARDANSGALVPAAYQSDPVQGPTVTIVAPADTVRVRGIPQLPPTLAVGTTDRAALTVVVRHPGGPQTGPVTLEALVLSCLDQADQPLVPAVFVDRARALRGGTEIGIVTSPATSGGQFTLPLGGTMLSPGETDSVEIRLDVQVTAPAQLFRLGLPASGILAFDANLGMPVAIAAETGATLPLTSGLTQLETPARTLAVGFQSSMPPVLASDGATVTFALVGLGNPAAPTAGAITVSGLTVRAADQDLAPIALGAAVARVEAWMGDSLWADTGDLAPDAATAVLTGGPLVLPPGPPRGLDLRAVLRPGASVRSLRLGFDANDVAVVQPPSQLLQVAVQAANGSTFPFWTDAGNFSAVSLEDSWSNFPNPFAAGRSRTTFAFYLPQSGRVTLKLWTARGKAVRTLVDAVALPAGLHQDLTWDGRNGRGETVTNGVYVAEIAVRFDDGSTARALRKVAVVR